MLTHTELHTPLHTEFLCIHEVRLYNAYCFYSMRCSCFCYSRLLCSTYIFNLSQFREECQWDIESRFVDCITLGNVDNDSIPLLQLLTNRSSSFPPRHSHIACFSVLLSSVSITSVLYFSCLRSVYFHLC